MNFYTKRRRPPTVPIITLIDIFAILLIFFIFTTTFKKRESLVKVTPPKSTEQIGASDRDVRVSLALNERGDISFGSQLVTIEQLPSVLRQFKATNPNGKLELKADEKAALGLMVKVWDAATKAGIEIEEIPLRILLDR